MPRPHPLALIAGLAAAGAGAGALALRLAPAPAPAAFAWPAPTAAMPPAPRPSLAPWPALFGHPPPPEPAPEPAAVEPAAPKLSDPAPVAVAPAPPPPRPDVRLLGLGVESAGGWALVETAEGGAILRPGAAIGPDHRLVEVRPDGALIDGPGGAWLLTFDDGPPPEASARRSLPRPVLGGVRYFYDEGDDAGGLPLPLPPAGYRAGPGPMAGDTR
jgi:hypothetical protein